MRTSSLNDKSNNEFENTFKKYILNKEITDNYEINIFIVIDTGNKDKIYNYFGDYLKGFSMQDYDNHNEILDFSKCESKYLEHYNYRKNNIDKFPIVTSPRINVIYIFYRLYFSYLLMKEYEDKYNIKHDYIVRIRPDCNFYDYLYNYIKMLDNTNKYILLDWDYGFLGKANIMIYICNLIFKYGEYNYNEIKHNDEITSKFMYNNFVYSQLSNDWRCWSESPEVQLYEHILNYIYNNNLNSDNIHQIKFTSPIHDRKN